MTDPCMTMPSSNGLASCFLYQIEVGLRELIIEVLAAESGSKWWKQRIPGDVYQKVRDGRDYERTIKWTQFVPHHPIYYTDFPDLRKIIERSDNWRAVFQDLFADKDIFINAFRELEPIRNKTAHNRKVTATDLQLVAAVHGAIVSALGEERFLALVMNCTTAPELYQMLSQLLTLIDETHRICQELAPLGQLASWTIVRDSWWFDQDYLGHGVDAIRQYFDLLDEYICLPRTRGSGHRLEQWLSKRPLTQLHDSAVCELDGILRATGGA